ncbi:cytochrome c1 [Sphingomonas ginkgonis]|uniref:Cytochrome c1 n=1 Tax=Sphingomonas ginkgonis TaxID=2315330 RepID=A0A429V969_9SPHN|nr:cytochrome c1 [Sphingomonas ginkgonis]RST30489.1 cytochrome c1 [Sphingomonas ginkgonis]
MVRKIGYLVGFGFVLALLLSLWSNVKDAIANPTPESATEQLHKEPRPLSLASDGPFGRFDRAQLQRGFQVYSEVCSACHSLKYVAFYDLAQLGYTPAEIKKIASDWKTEVPTVNPDTGEASTRKALASDHFPSPFANETAARAANNNALPPDLSLITKAREGGAPYVHSLITGYAAQTPDLVRKYPEVKTPTGLHYNPYFANLNIAMPPPLTSDGQVEYKDGTKPTVDQMAKDVSAFLVWTAEPKLENRHRAGLAAIVFLLFGTVFAYFAYRTIWAEAKRKVQAKGPLDPEHRATMDKQKAEHGIAG